VATTALAGSLPRITPVARVSPTLGESLRACSLQVAFRLDPRFKPYRRPGTAAALGIAAHELLEQVGNGDLAGVPTAEIESELERRWQALVAEQHEQLCTAWPLGTVPAPERWPGYELTHTRLIASLGSRTQSATMSRSPDAAAPVETELWLEDGDGAVGGRVDRVEHTAGGTRIVDLKSGWSVRAELTEPQRRQLLIYAYLWHAKTGEWPTEAAIQLPDGARLELEVTPQDAEAVANELRATRQRYNAKAASGAAPADLASPDNETCGRCAFKASCPYFLASSSPTWEWYRPTVLIEIESIQATDSVTVVRGKARATTSTATAQPGEPATVAAPSGLDLEAGQLVALADARHQRQPGNLTVSWDSTIAEWDTTAATAFEAAPRRRETS
jgi:hypothetical protein